MKVFAYSANREAPIEGLYEELGSSELLISNREQDIRSFEQYQKQLLIWVGNDVQTDKVFLVPKPVNEIFRNWVENSNEVKWNRKETVSKPDLKIIGGNELNEFLNDMNVEEEWDSVSLKPGETTEPSQSNSSKPQDNKMDNNSIGLSSHLVVIFVSIIVIIISIPTLVGLKGKEIEQSEADKAFVEGRYDDAQNLANGVNKSYAKTMAVAIKEIERVILSNEPTPPSPNESKPDKVQQEKLLKFLQNANDALQALQLTTPPENNAVLWTRQMLEIEGENSAAKNILERVIEKYLGLYGKPDKLPTLSQVLNTPVLPQTQLKDYATKEQRTRITELLGENYWSQ